MVGDFLRRLFDHDPFLLNVFVLASRSHNQRISSPAIQSCNEQKVTYFICNHQPNILPGIFLHAERTAGQTRADGTVPRPSLLERYLHRPLDTAFDEMDIATYHSEHAMSKTPPQYAASNTWTEKPWGDCANHLLVYRQRPTPKVLKILLNICWPKISRHNACVQRITLYPIHD